MREFVRNARVNKDIDQDYDTTLKRVKRASLFAGAATMLAFMATGKVPPNMRRNIFFGSTFALGLGAQLVRHDDPGVAIVSNVLSTAAGFVAFKGAQKLGLLGLKAVKDDLQRRGNSAIINTIEAAVINAKKKFPLLKGVLSDETIGTAGALVTIPVAHSVITRHLAAWKRKHTDHGDASFLPSQMQNQAGLSPDRAEPVKIGSEGSMIADLHFRGSVMSHYNTAEALEEI